VGSIWKRPDSVPGGFGVSYDVTFQNLTTLQLPPQFQVEQNEAITFRAGGNCAGHGGATGTGFLWLAADCFALVVPQTVAEASRFVGLSYR